MLVGNSFLFGYWYGILGKAVLYLYHSCWYLFLIAVLLAWGSSVVLLLCKCWLLMDALQLLSYL